MEVGLDGWQVGRRSWIICLAPLVEKSCESFLHEEAKKPTPSELEGRGDKFPLTPEERARQYCRDEQLMDGDRVDSEIPADRLQLRQDCEQLFGADTK